jgi:hypothetical protein
MKVDKDGKPVDGYYYYDDGYYYDDFDYASAPKKAGNKANRAFTSDSPDSFDVDDLVDDYIVDDEAGGWYANGYGGNSYYYSAAVERQADGNTLNWATTNNPLGFKLTPEVQQERRGNSWVVAASSAITASVNLNSGSRVLSFLRPKALRDNVKGEAVSGKALKYAAKHGVLTNQKSLSLYRGNIATIDHFERVPRNHEADLLDKLLDGPVIVRICAGSQKFMYYKTGILNDADACDNARTTDHTVLLTGYGTDESGTDYRVIQNSWGKDWGEDGYARIQRSDKNGSPGMYNIATRAIQPVGGAVAPSLWAFFYQNATIMSCLCVLTLGVFGVIGAMKQQRDRKVAVQHGVQGYETVPDAEDHFQLTEMAVQPGSYQSAPASDV